MGYWYTYYVKYTFAVKHFSLDPACEEFVVRQVEKLRRFLKDIDHESLVVEIVVRQEKARSPHHEGGVEGESLDKKRNRDLSPYYYSGTIHLRLPKKMLVATLDGAHAEEALRVGFDRLFREIEKYKGKHFPSYSQYMDRSSIRKA